MKKLFVAILALGALASCQKENLPVVEEAKNKTIEINILNLVEETKATQGGDTAYGTNKLCAEFGELKVLFATAGGEVKYEFPLSGTGVGDDHKDGENVNTGNNVGGDWTDTDAIIEDTTLKSDAGTRRWHNVPAEIKKIAVVRYETNDFDGLVGKNLSVIENLSKDQDANLDRPIEKMVLCGIGTLSDTGETHRVGDIVYHVWEANVNVAPAFARFEVRSIKCTNLGNLNNDYLVNTEGEQVLDENGKPILDPNTYGFDELLLKSLTLTYGGKPYTAPGFGESVRIYGSYTPKVPAEGEDYPYDPNTYPVTAPDRAAEGTTANEYKPQNGAWSWNLTPGKNFNNLKLDIDAYAYDYQVSYAADQKDRNFPLNVVGLAATEGGAADTSVFEAGSIYTINLIFTEANIKDPEGICVDVVVTVNAWNVVERYPIYGNN